MWKVLGLEIELPALESIRNVNVESVIYKFSIFIASKGSEILLQTVEFRVIIVRYLLAFVRGFLWKGGVLVLNPYGSVHMCLRGYTENNCLVSYKIDKFDRSKGKFLDRCIDKIYIGRDNVSLVDN